MTSDRPRLLRDPAQIVARRAELSEPHVAPLVAYVHSLREAGYGEVPDFDPWDGGVGARALFLYEKPGPKAFASGFISRNNDDPTAEASFKFMNQAGFERKQTCTWNVVPGWNGTTKVTAAELQRGVDALRGLIDLLDELKVIVLVGKKATRALPLLAHTGLPIIQSLHPSPKVRATAREKWESIPASWAQARSLLDK